MIYQIHNRNNIKNNPQSGSPTLNPQATKSFFVSTDKLIAWQAKNLEQGKIIEKIRLLLKNYLELDNVSFLFGSGTSIHLGAVSIS
jgi:hypothetical protein